MDEWSAADIDAYRQASMRMTIVRGKNGFLSVEEKSARELNISPALYAACTKIIDNTNRFLEKKAEEIRKNVLPLLKTKGEFDYWYSPSDCVAATIAAGLKYYGMSDATSDPINAQFEERYGKGQGVPADKFNKELREYFTGHEVALNSIPNRYDLDDNPGNLYLLGLKMANYGGHAVTLIRFDGEWLDVKDDQNNQRIKVHQSEVVKIFKATGLRTN